MAKYKKYYSKGGRVPGMFKRQEGGDIPEGTTNTSISPDGNTINTVNINRGDTTRTSRPNPWGRNQLANLSLSNAIKENQLQQGTMVQKRMNEMIMQMKIQNQSLEQQNQLLKTQIEKSDLINSARNTKQKPGAKNTPKRRGGTVKAKKGKEKMMWFAQSNGGTMRRGGSCSPLMKRSKRR